MMLGMATSTPGTLSEEHMKLLSRATGRDEVADALEWIAERRRLSTVPVNQLLQALVAASDAGLPQSRAALREASRSALSSTLDTSADLLAIDTITVPDRYERALVELASRTRSGSLTDISAGIVGASQAANADVVETLGLVAGLSWRDLRDRATARGTTLPGESTGPWNSTQIETAFDIIDEVISGRRRPQIEGAAAAKPVELLLTPGSTGWETVQSLWAGRVPYATLLTQRAVGGAWGAHRNRTNNQISSLMVERLIEALDAAEVPHWSTEGAHPVGAKFLAGKAVRAGRSVGHLQVVTRTQVDVPRLAIFVSVARDGGTTRRSAATLLKLPSELVLPGAAVLVGTGWSARGESDDLVRAFGGRIYNERTLDDLAALCARDVRGT